MKSWKKALGFTWCGLFAVTLSGSALSVAAQQAAVLRDNAPAAPVTTKDDDQAGPNQPPRANQSKIVELPDSPGATVSKSAGAANDAANQQTTGRSWTVAALSTQPTQSQTAGTAVQAVPQKPVGTAVAETPNAGGVAASQPAGVAIAPAKQRRVRTIMLRMGAIVGAGVAVGSVVALTAATPSKPPGAH
jgi:hypothetical protein